MPTGALFLLLMTILLELFLVLFLAHLFAPLFDYRTHTSKATLLLPGK